MGDIPLEEAEMLKFTINVKDSSLDGIADELGKHGDEYELRARKGGEVYLSKAPSNALQKWWQNLGGRQERIALAREFVLDKFDSKFGGGASPAGRGIILRHCRENASIRAYQTALAEASQLQLPESLSEFLSKESKKADGLIESFVSYLERQGPMPASYRKWMDLYVKGNVAASKDPATRIQALREMLEDMKALAKSDPELQSFTVFALPEDFHQQCKEISVMIDEGNDKALGAINSLIEFHLRRNLHKEYEFFSGKI